jgi:hypothetical protein
MLTKVTGTLSLRYRVRVATELLRGVGFRYFLASIR